MSEKKEVKPAEKKVTGILAKHPVLQNKARELFRNENGMTVVQERVPRGDLPQEEEIMPRNEWDLTEEDLKGLVDHAKKMVDPILSKYDEDVALEDALSKAVWSKDGGKYQGRLSACTQKIVLDAMRGKSAQTSKKAADSGWRGKTKGQLAEEFKEKGLFKEYDGALPQGWLDEFAIKAGPDSYDKILSSFVWAYDKGATGFPFPLTDEAKELLRKHYPRYYEFLPKSVKSNVQKATERNKELESGNTNKGDKPPKEAGMDKEMLRKEADDLRKKLNALKVLLCEDGKDDKDDDMVPEDKAAAKQPVKEVAAESAPTAPAAPETKEVAEESVLASLDEIAEMVEKEAHAKNDFDLFRIAFQIDRVSDYLSGSKDASTLEQDADEEYMRKAFKSGVNEHDADEPYMKEFSNDNTRETSRVVGNISVQHKAASELPYAVKKDA